MHNAITLQAAARLENKLLETDIPLAVFAQHGSWHITKTNTTSFQEQLRKRPSQLVGIYTAAVKLEDIADDFAEAGIK